MMLATRRRTTPIDIGDNNPLLYDARYSSENSRKTYLLSQSPPPMSYRDLRSVMSTKIPSDIVTLPDSINAPNAKKSKSSRKSAQRRKYQRQAIDVYRSVARTESRCSNLSERDIINDEMMLFANSFIIDHISSPVTCGFFHPQNLPNIQKHRTNNNNNNRIGSTHTKSSYSSSPSLQIQHVGHKRPTTSQTTRRVTPPHVIYHTTSPQFIHRPLLSPSPQLIHPTLPSSQFMYPLFPSPQFIPPTLPPSQFICRATPPQLIHQTTPADSECEEEEEDNNEMTLISSLVPEVQTRKQLHVYMPQILSC